MAACRHLCLERLSIGHLDYYVSNLLSYPQVTGYSFSFFMAAVNILTNSTQSELKYDRGQVHVMFLRTELFPYSFPSDAPATRKCGGRYFIVSLYF